MSKQDPLESRNYNLDLGINRLEGLSKEGTICPRVSGEASCILPVLKYIANLQNIWRQNYRHLLVHAVIYMKLLSFTQNQILFTQNYCHLLETYCHLLKIMSFTWNYCNLLEMVVIYCCHLIETPVIHLKLLSFTWNQKVLSASLFEITYKPLCLLCMVYIVQLKYGWYNQTITRVPCRWNRLNSKTFKV